MTKLKFWYRSGSCSLAPHILLRELDLDVETIHVTDFSANALGLINPKQRVPVLSIDDEIITEAPAILTALAQLGSPDRKLLGSTLIETARVYEWLNWLSGHLHGLGYGGLWRPERYSDDASALEGIKAKGKSTIIAAYEFIESRLLGLHAVGDAFTVVDLYLLVFYRWGKGIGLEMEKEYPKYTALIANLVKRDAVIKTLEEVKLPPVFAQKI
ncbi:glutathione S-transferase [Blastomyces parvus]|uniref:Glutathione S-transferase n=1 Tax=Blastomyces parvus TaxID=2060905 RepID=A0A2B7WY16_9EURO|nr:glutathione S-transferase [Blastomyces parvus]